MTEKELTQKIYMILLKKHIKTNSPNYVLTSEMIHYFAQSAKEQAQILIKLY